MNIRIAGLTNDSIVDGQGIRYTIFTQGCPHHCPGCHNQTALPIDGGKDAAVEEILAKIKQNPLLDGITLSGGEPFLQADPCTVLAMEAHALGLTVWTYTGFTYEVLLAGIADNPEWGSLLNETDVLVDGPFMQNEKSLELAFRGSKNQRLIDMKKTRDSGEIVLWERPQW